MKDALTSAINICGIGSQSDCPLEGEWLTGSPHLTQTTITQRNATTVYATSNYTILDVYDLSEASPTNFTAAMFLQVFDSVFSISNATPSINSDFNSMIQLGSVSFPSNDSVIDVQLVTHLERIIALPVSVYNDNFLNGAYGGLPPNQKATVRGAFATASQRVKTLLCPRLTKS